MTVVPIVSPEELLDRIAALPGAAAVLGAVADLEAVYAVGGVPRDLLLGRTPLDLDLVVEGDALPAAHAAAARLGGRVRAHDRFGTATVQAGTLAFDLATARAERYPAPGALPEVSAAPLEADLRRRDVTVNAIAVALGSAERGRVRHVPGALEDLDARRLRVLHDGSFRDDPTRLLRVARYAARLGFELEPATTALARDALASGALATVTPPRIGRELRLLLDEPDVLAALVAAERLGVLAGLDARLVLDRPLAAAVLDLLPADADRGRALLASCALEFDPAALEAWLDALEFPAADRDVVVAAARDARELARALEAAQGPSEIAAAAGAAMPETVALAGALGARGAARQWLERLRHVRLEIDGGDLIAAGVAEGPAVGRGLAAALAARLDGRADDRESELAAALEGGAP